MLKTIWQRSESEDSEINDFDFLTLYTHQRREIATNFVST